MSRKKITEKISNMDKKTLSVIVFSLFFSWLLAFPFEGQVLYAVTGKFNINARSMVFGAIAAHFIGLFFCGFFIKSIKATKKLMIFSIIFCIIGSLPFFLSPSILWNILLFLLSLMASCCVAAWGFYYNAYTPSSGRIKTAADALIYSNILMILINMTAIHLSAYAGLGLSIIMLCGALFFAARLPEDAETDSRCSGAEYKKTISPIKPLAFLCIFIIIITINSGLMYQVINPAFAHHKWLVSWYWAIPYIVALYIVKNLPGKTDRNYLLYVAIAMIGLSFTAFMVLDRSVASYLVVNTLMLGACGVYDLFWWSILGEMLDFHDNPVKILGIGLSANVLGVLIGGMLGNAIVASGARAYSPSVLALVIVFIILVILPLLNKYLSMLLKSHVFLSALYEIAPSKQNDAIDSLTIMGKLTVRESEIVALLLKGRTYKMVADELHLSENTVKTHIKNIYSKLNIQSKAELVNLLTEKNST
ncbi:helix-turn-helix domain-containing protein [Lutispora saccharofermentans]|uniref:Helix-turn-helix transcriptional regulator n=1 Tax=Lutispora saccharofermentans TaxID=3024236 RepID=A0ABT1NH56_9FIRM|nr:helix-turn-helix transcriptional regulator [Lutispora saccharofermentans]MCQ1529641.1 helix-turn-helix transcriptional regulator [Lutispora saccharofermentans]